MRSTSFLAYSLFFASSLFLTACDKDDDDNDDDLPERIAFTAARQYPEGISWSDELDRFVITSLTQGKIGTVDDDGRYADLITPAELISGVGLKVAAGKIYVCNSDNGVSTKSTTATTQKTAELLVFNINSRQLEQRVDLDALLPNENHFANDVAVGSNGMVYVTDSRSPVIYQITSSGQASILVRDDARFTATMFGLNGIVYHPNGYLIVANTGSGKLYKVNLQSGNAITEITGLPSLPGDGLLLKNNNELYVVNTSGTRVTQVRTTDNFATAAAGKTDEGVYSGATTSTLAEGKVYTLNARIGEISAAMGNAAALQSNDYSIQRFRD